ncbi:copper chaperone PCu(A)C [Corynebacterium uterequi]|uniref:Copper chaperone PCu(A)C n=1 Tax=Corynebacterium uterequi TaxID=1072256 RepID=A0A0G3HH48_9CORY|nr:copper chaperone PCu(A)C [Corynebacterium uterequi]AKK11248.1 hypothetical protein CUTER_06260 [Corynebacterium uterequi]
MKRSLFIAVAAASALAITACSPQLENPSSKTKESAEVSTTAAAPSSEATSSATTEPAADTAISFTDSVVREKAADSNMTAIFGTLTNNTDAEVVITGFSTDLGQARYEIHEVVNGQMQMRPTPITLAPGESFELAAGGDHFMIMDFAGEVPAGAEVVVTLELADGSMVELEPAPVRAMPAGGESYGADGELAGHDHAGHDHANHN